MFRQYLPVFQSLETKEINLFLLNVTPFALPEAVKVVIVRKFGVFFGRLIWETPEEFLLLSVALEVNGPS